MSYSSSTYGNKHLSKALLIALFAFTSTVLADTPDTQPQALQADPENAQQVQRGELVYQRFCSLCHGAKLEGQPDWRKRKLDGKLPAPPHDETGHTWHHSDTLLFGITKYGLVPPYAPENYLSDMPAWGSTLNDHDIWAVIAYIKSRWPDQTRKTQTKMNQNSLQ